MARLPTQESEVIEKDAIDGKFYIVKTVIRNTEVTKQVLKDKIDELRTQKQAFIADYQATIDKLQARVDQIVALGG
jgi:hypothetical protein